METQRSLKIETVGRNCFCRMQVYYFVIECCEAFVQM